MEINAYYEERLKMQKLVDVLEEAQDVFQTHKNTNFMLEETKYETIKVITIYVYI